ncbi:hypothetical protein VTK26DRAFT_7375 [Humicola hyalothermophila]
METQPRPRPSLQPVWTGHQQHQDPSHPSPSSARSPLYSASVRRDGLPSPMYPASPGYDQSMRMHERALVDRLDQRGRQEHHQSPTTTRSLSPISEQPALSARRASVASLPLPNAPAPSPQSPGFAVQYPRRQTLAAETRSILLSGLPDGLPRIQPSEAGGTVDRRQSLPVTSPNSRWERRTSLQIRQELQAWGHIFFRNASEANCFVSAVALRRSSDSSSAEEGTTAGGMGKNLVTIRARVRPCALDRKPFLIKRTFDMDELRATIPELPTVSAGTRRISTDLGTRSPLPARRRRSSMAARTESGADLDKSPIRGTHIVPIHVQYARAFFPVLAALIYSKHVQQRDIIDLPMPHPEAWVQTVTHVYTGQGELTEAIKQNILYLGGKV